MSLCRLLGCVLATALLSLAFLPPTAYADSPPERTSPEAGAVLARPPAAVDVWLSVAIDGSKPAEVRVVHNPSGRRVDRESESPVDPGDGKHLRAVLVPDLGPGRYVVSWEGTAVDGEPAGPSSFSFTVAEPGTGNDDRVTVMLAVFGAAGFAVLVGGVGYLLRRQLGLVAPPPGPPPEHH